MTVTIPHRELRNNSSEVLRRVRLGETIEVTNHGEVVAVLIPPDRRAGAALRVRAATRRGGFSELARAPLDVPVQELLDELRGDL